MYPPSPIVYLSFALSVCYTSHGALTFAQNCHIPLPVWLWCSRGGKCCKLNFCEAMSHSRICKNPFCKWNLLFIRPRAMALSKSSSDLRFDMRVLVLDIYHRMNLHTYCIEFGSRACTSCPLPLEISSTLLEIEKMAALGCTG